MTQTKDKLDPYQQAIKDYLDKRAEEDPAFAEKYRAGLAGKKDIRACCSYIIDQVKKTGRRGFSDPEIYGMAMHFYDEDSIEPSDRRNYGCTVVVNKDLPADKPAPKAEAKPAVDEKKLRAEIRKEEAAKIRKAERERQAAEKKKAQEKRAAEELKRKEEAKRRALEAGPLLFDFK